jgi:hypothetical protein
MIINNYRELDKEYSRRMQEGLLVCRMCEANDGKPIVRRRKHSTGDKKHKLPFKWGLLNIPYGWEKEVCECGKIFPAIKYDVIEYI